MDVMYLVTTHYPDGVHREIFESEKDACIAARQVARISMANDWDWKVTITPVQFNPSGAVYSYRSFLQED